MRLVLRRASAARALLAAAGALALLATLLLTGLAGYSRQVVAAGAAATLAAAAPERTSVLVRGPAGDDPPGFASRDDAVRARFDGGLGGVPVAVSGAAYASGRSLAGDTGDAVPDQGGLVYASVALLDDLPAHADLVSGAWPRPGAAPVRTAVAAGAAGVLGLSTGDRVPLTDRVSGRGTELEVSGVWRPRDVADPYWRLVPDVTTGVAAGSATYGPLVVDRADFTRDFSARASAAWLAALDLRGADLAGLRRAAAAVAAERAALPAATGLGRSGDVDSGVEQLAGVLDRADLVGRSTLVTPVLIVGVLGGLALLLVAVLLTEHRRAESALLRARGATAGQLAALAAVEAVALVLPGAVLAPPAVAWALRAAATRGWAGLGAPDGLATGGLAAGGLAPGPLLWLVAGLAAAGCALAVVLPVLRGGTYVSEMAVVSRPDRRPLVQRAGVDLLLIVLAVLACVQLRRFSSPLVDGAGGLGVDPLLAAAPCLGIVAGAALAARLLAPTVRLTARVLGRGTRFPSMLGLWQAGRRPHAGPVLLLALAVAAGTVAWSVAATGRRSVTDQVDHTVGADLRLTEAGGTAPPGRARDLAGLPGAGPVVPVRRDSVQTEAAAASVELVALDGTAAGDTVRVRDDLYAGGATGLARALTSGRVPEPLVGLPAGARLTGRITTTGVDGPVTVTAVLFDPAGSEEYVALSTGAFTGVLPAGGGPLRLAGFQVSGDAAFGATVGWELSGLAVDGVPVRTDGAWGTAGPTANTGTTDGASGVVRVTVLGAHTGPTRFAVVRPARVAAVPVVLTPRARRALRITGDAPVTLRIGGARVPVHPVGSIVAVPGTDDPAAALVDLPTLRAYLWQQEGRTRPAREWWMTVGDGAHVRAADAAARLGGLRVLDRRDVAARSVTEAYGLGGRTALTVAALGALLLAAAGVLVDVRTTTRRRIGELAVLHTLGAGPGVLARALLTEQAFLAGVGVLTGLAAGVAVTAAMAPPLVLTPLAARPVPPASLVVDWWAALGTAGLLLVLALALSAAAGAALPRRLAGARLHMGADR
ncbi:FtsX-like permease family protein [Actinoplanes sp. NPDC051494]|uniref:FtsX-like permease family protein n=1 Tax=Actinoplanes sp. NPDC051494 TaxID=3363907 RepID=UPI0037A6BA8D